MRTGRKRLTDRFSRWFQDVEIPDLMRSLDPRLARVPILIRGERGSGRSLLARYLHTFGGGSDAAFISIPSSEIQNSEELLQRLEGMRDSTPGGSAQWTRRGPPWCRRPAGTARPGVASRVAGAWVWVVCVSEARGVHGCVVAP